MSSASRGRRPVSTLAAGLAAVAVPVAGTATPSRAAGTTERVSVGPGGRQANGDSLPARAISADGRYVAFVSFATNLVPGDTNGQPDVFVRDRQAGRTERVSVATDGAQGDRASGYIVEHVTTLPGVAISADGRFVAFQSNANNLVPGETNLGTDIFLRDREAGTTERVSLADDGGQADNGSFLPAISAGGRFVAFESYAANLVPGDTNRTVDVFVRDRRTRRTERVSVSTGGAQAGGAYLAAMSADGRFVAFDSGAADLVPGDANGVADVFVRDRQEGTTERVSVGPGGRQANRQSESSAISAGGRFVAFVSYASNLVPGDTNGVGDVFVRDRLNRRTERVSVGRGGVQGNGDPGLYPTISPGGLFVAFDSLASNLVPGDTNGTYDAFLRDRLTGTTERVGVGRFGAQAAQGAGGGGVSGFGRHVVFSSAAGNLVPGDTNGAFDVFVRSR